MNGHLTKDALIDRLYGVASSDVDLHLGGCVECREQLHALEMRRADSAAMPVVSADVLVEQRRKIRNRLESPASRIKWVPAMAAACLLVAVALVYQPGGEPITITKSAPEVNDAQLFAELYAIERAEEPKAVAPIHHLFESGASVGTQ